MITKDYLQIIFDYRDGNLYYKEKVGKMTIGKKAGGYNKCGYYNIDINRVKYRLHRMIFLWHHGFLAPEIDHINGIKTDNRIENLRASTKGQNLRNSKIRKNNSSGYKNVYFDKKENKYIVELRTDGKCKRIGRFKDLELADLVAQEARNKYHKEFARHI